MKQCVSGIRMNAGHMFPKPTVKGAWGTGSWSWSSTPEQDDACLRCGTLWRDTREAQHSRRVYELLQEANGH